MKTFIATAPAAYRPLIGAALTIAVEDARRDMNRRDLGDEATVPDTLRDPQNEGNILVVVMPMPEGAPFSEFLSHVQDGTLAGHYDPAGETAGMRAAVAEFRRRSGEGARVVSTTAIGSGESTVGLVESNPVVVLDDGSVFEMLQDRTWHRRTPVPGTPAGLAAVERARIARLSGDMEE